MRKRKKKIAAVAIAAYVTIPFIIGLNAVDLERWFFLDRVDDFLTDYDQRQHPEFTLDSDPVVPEKEIQPPEWVRNILDGEEATGIQDAPSVPQDAPSTTYIPEGKTLYGGDTESLWEPVPLVRVYATDGQHEPKAPTVPEAVRTIEPEASAVPEPAREEPEPVQTEPHGVRDENTELILSWFKMARFEEEDGTQVVGPLEDLEDGGSTWIVQSMGKKFEKGKNDITFFNS